MGSNGGEDLKMPASAPAESSKTTVEIKIKTLDSQTFTLLVDKCVPVPELKEQIASVTGVVSEQQRLICRGKVLKDDQRLSAYHVEDGHTLHLVVRQPVAPSPDLSDNPESDPTLGTGHSQGNRIGPGMVVGTFNIPEQGDGGFPDLNRIVSAVLNSFGVTRLGGSEGIDLNQPPSERPSASPTPNDARNSSRLQVGQTASLSLPVESVQPPIIPDSLTTLLQYLGHLRQEFIANAGGPSINAQNVAFSGGDGQVGQDLEPAPHSSEPRALLTPETLAEVMSRSRLLLVEQVTECLMQLSRQLESHSGVVDPLERSRVQSNAIRSGSLIQNLGSLLLELGRAIMTLRMGQTPADALVNAGPSVFVSSTGPNPIMVQPLPLQPGVNFGSVPIGSVQHGSGLAGSSAAGTAFLPRNIDIRIRTGSLFPRRETTSSQPQGQVGSMPSNTSGFGQQDATLPDSNLRNREPQMRAVPVRTVVAAVPASVRRESRDSDSSRGSIGILYPVLARVQNVSLGNSIGARASQPSDQHQHDRNGNSEQTVSDAAIQQQNIAVPDFNVSPFEALNVQGSPAMTRGGIEQLLSTMFPQDHIRNNNANPLSSGSGPTRSEAVQGIGSSQVPASAVSDQGLLLSNILRQIMPMVSENTEARSVPSAEEAENAQVHEVPAQDDPDQSSTSQRQGHPSPPSPKRRRLE